MQTAASVKVISELLSEMHNLAGHFKRAAHLHEGSATTTSVDRLWHVLPDEKTKSIRVIVPAVRRNLDVFTCNEKCSASVKDQW